MRVRAEILVQEPLVRYVTVNSVKTKTIEHYDVMYERLPFYCFSCGLLGHSSMLCPNPGAHDVNEDLPYVAKRLCAPEEMSRRSSGSSQAANLLIHLLIPRTRVVDHLLVMLGMLIAVASLPLNVGCMTRKLMGPLVSRITSQVEDMVDLLVGEAVAGLMTLVRKLNRFKD